MDKVTQWEKFSVIVAGHIKDYAIAQYGDFPDEQVDNYTLEEIRSKMAHYVNRIGRGVRGPEVAIADSLKIAHFANYLHSLLTTGSAQS